MKKLLFPLLFLPLFSLSLLAQDRSLGLEIDGHWGSSRLVAGSDLLFTELETIDSLESGRFDGTLGLAFESSGERIGYTIGLRYLRTGFETELQNLSRSESFSSVTQANYLSLPFEVNFYQEVLPRHRVLFFLGATANLHLRTETTTSSFVNGAPAGVETVTDRDDYRPLVFALSTGVGYDYRLTDRWAIRLQPNFHFFLGGSIKDSSFLRVNRNYYQLGGRLTIRRLLR